MRFDEWLQDVDGQVVGDGQCVALCQDYSARVVQGGFLSTDGGRWPGYAGSIWDGGLNDDRWTKHSPVSIAMPGWLAVWGTSPFTPSTHVAVVINDAGVGVNTETQNPGAARRMVIPKVGLLGYMSCDSAGGGSAEGGTRLAGDTTNPVETGVNVVSGLTQAKDFVSDAGNWKRIGVYALGVLLLVLAVLYLFKNETMTLVKETLK